MLIGVGSWRRPRPKLLIHLAVEGSLFGAYPQNVPLSVISSGLVRDFPRIPEGRMTFGTTFRATWPPGRLIQLTS